MDTLKKIDEFLKNDRVLGVISILAALIMYVTPDEIDMIIEAGLGLIGAKKIVLPNLKK